MSLYARAEGFPDTPEQSIQWQQVPVAGDSAVVTFAPAPHGPYAVAAFHDEDGDGALRRDWVGRPKEGWGVSRDAKARFGPPRFEDSMFTAAADTFTVRIRIRY